jgi:hypothetical protein
LADHPFADYLDNGRTLPGPVGVATGALVVGTDVPFVPDRRRQGASQDKSEDGFLGRFAAEKGDAIHHFCLLSDNIEEDVEELKQRGVEMMDQKPRIGLRGKKIAMTTPSALNGITIELSEP